MGFMITSETSKQYLLEEDAVKGFEMAVTNGQSRLALSILVDIVNGFMEVFNAMMEEETSEEIVDQEQSTKQEPKQEAKVQEKKKSEQKQDSKKETETPKDTNNQV